MPNRQKDFLKYRDLHPTFIYENFEYTINNKEVIVRFVFILEGISLANSSLIRFEPTLHLPLPSSINKEDFQVEILENLLFHMGMVELISYWKAACPSKVIIKPYSLDEHQIRFWKKLYWNGLGEFFYVNEIETTLDDFMQISSTSDRSVRANFSPLEERIIVPIGGGKDSAVSLELLKASGHELYPFIINPRGASLNTVKQSGISESNLLVAKRSIDKTLLRLNEQGYLNGHTPFSAMLAFTSLLQAYLTRSKYIALSNESSANEASVPGSHVNHQYSKTYEFEADFRSYYKKYISPEIEYFSFLRPLSELQIACLFAQLDKHHFSFRSCNVGSKTDSWCGNCSKCLFTYIMLAPFLPEQKLTAMLGENLIAKSSLAPVLKELQGLTATKPFECVGTVDEVNLALYQAIQHNDYSSSAIVINQVSTDNPNDARFKKALKDWNNAHFLPEFLVIILKKKLSTC